MDLFFNLGVNNNYDWGVNKVSKLGRKKKLDIWKYISLFISYYKVNI